MVGLWRNKWMMNIDNDGYMTKKVDKLWIKNGK